MGFPLAREDKAQYPSPRIEFFQSFNLNLFKIVYTNYL